MGTHPPKLRKKNRVLEIAGEVLEGAIPLVTAIVQLRNNPRTIDYLALGVAAINAAVKGKKAYNQLMQPSPQAYFAARGEDGDFVWKECPFSLSRFVYQCIEDVEEHLDTGNADVRFGATSILHGSVGEEIIGWEGQEYSRNRYNPATEVPLLYYIRKREKQLFDAVSARLWERVESNHLQLKRRNFEAVNEDPGEVYITPDIEKLLDRVSKFLASGETRAYLLEGSPGTGKTTAIRYVVKKLGLRSLRISPKTLIDHNQNDIDVSTAGNTLAMLAVTKPDVLILDDIDHCEDDPEVLDILTTCRKHCRIIIGSANNKWRLDGATLRAGRFDDHIEFHKLPLGARKTILGKYEHLAEQMEEWPIIYITDFVHKANVLGEEAALMEMEEINSRLEKIDEAIQNDTATKVPRHLR